MKGISVSGWIVVVGSFLLFGPMTAAAGGMSSFDSVMEEVEDVGDITIYVGPNFLLVSWQGIELGSNASTQLRYHIDQLGEADGTVSEDEAESAKTILSEFITQEFRKYKSRANFDGYLLIDQSNPDSVKVENLAAGGVVGPVESDEGIMVSFIARVLFDTQESATHTVKLDMGRYYFKAVDRDQAERYAGDLSLTIQGAKDWTIDASTIQPGCAAERFDGERMVFQANDVNCFTEQTGVIIAFSIHGDGQDVWNLPGPGPALLVLGLLGLALALRRRL